MVTEIMKKACGRSDLISMRKLLWVAGILDQGFPGDETSGKQVVKFDINLI